MPIASDESFSPIVEAERDVFESQCPDATITPIYTSESEAINLLLSDSVCLAITSRDFKPEELQSLRDRAFRPQTVRLAYDGLALIAHKDNPDSCISVKNIKDIMSGTVTKWSDIYPKSKLGEIVVVFDNPTSSAVHFVEDSILGGKPITSPNVAAAKTSADVIKYVETTPNAVGIIGSNWLNDKGDSTNLTFNRNIRTMRVSKYDDPTPGNSFQPYQAYLYDGRYPLRRIIYGLLNDPYRGLPWSFAHFIEDSKGQRIILRAGLLPMYGNIMVRDVITK